MKAAFWLWGKMFLFMERNAKKNKGLALSFLSITAFFFFFGLIKHNFSEHLGTKSQLGCQSCQMYLYTSSFKDLLIFMDELGL